MDNSVPSFKKYKVVIDEKTFSVFKNNKIVVDKQPYTGYFVDESVSPPRDIGNTLLFNIGNRKYMFVGINIYTFNLREDEIIDFKSPVGNNFIPTPYAVGKIKTYLLADEYVWVDNAKLKAEKIDFPYAYNLNKIPLRKSRKTYYNQTHAYKKNHSFKITLIDGKK
jgi:hypothetical protein